MSSAEPQRSMSLFYGLTLFLSAGLLFAVQPLLGKQMLPLVGGSPSGWLTALAFFQMALLAGYLLAHGLSRLSARRQAWATAGLLVLVGALLVWFGIPFVKHDPGGSSDPVGASDSGTFANIRGELLEASKQSPLGAVGDCVNITGPSKNDATVQKISCGDKSAAYRIFQLADEPRDCAADSDQRYAPRATDEGNLILCLDYNWAHGLCIYPGSARGPWHAVRNDCHSGGERPVEVQYDTANAQGCPTGGYPHQERRFTICSTLLP